MKFTIFLLLIFIILSCSSKASNNKSEEKKISKGPLKKPILIVNDANSIKEQFVELKGNIIRFSVAYNSLRCNDFQRFIEMSGDTIFIIHDRTNGRYKKINSSYNISGEIKLFDNEITTFCISDRTKKTKEFPNDIIRFSKDLLGSGK